MRVGAFSIHVAIVAAIRAFVYIDTTRLPMTCAMEPIEACAFVASIDIVAFGLCMAIVHALITLINVTTTFYIVWLGERYCIGFREKSRRT
jgi:hypothetical protein